MTPRPNNVHERLADGERAAPGSDRAFGAAFAALFAVVGAVAWIRGGAPTAWPFVVSGAFLVAALLTPELLTPLNKARAKLSLFLSHCFYPPPLLRISSFLLRYLVEHPLACGGLAARRRSRRSVLQAKRSLS